MRVAHLAIVLAGCGFEPGSLAVARDAAVIADADAMSLVDAMVDAQPIDPRVCPAAPPSCIAFKCASSTSCYYICGTATTGKQSYSGASGSCTAAGVGCVVTINDQAENDCIAAATIPWFPDALVWLGYEQASGGAEPGGGWSWQCSSSTFVAANWGMFEPNNSGGNEDCSTMSGGGVWIDATCSGSARFVCELP